MRLDRAVDLWIGELARAGRTESTRASYERHLFKLIAHLERARHVGEAREVTTNDCGAFLDNWLGASPSTVCSVHSAVKGFFHWLYMEGEVDANPMDRIPRPRRPRPRTSTS